MSFSKTQKYHFMGVQNWWLLVWNLGWFLMNSLAFHVGVFQLYYGALAHITRIMDIMFCLGFIKHRLHQRVQVVRFEGTSWPEGSTLEWLILFAGSCNSWVA